MTPSDETRLADYEGRVVRLTSERLAHVLLHPEMDGQLDRIRETLLEPDLIVATRADDTVRVYHRRYASTPVTRKYLHVAVKILPDDAFVLTAYYSSRRKRGVTIWPE
jgi:hypothetical protein